MSVFAARRKRAVALAGERAFVTRDLATIRYLSGFSGSNATMVFSRDGGTLITDGRYQDQVHEETDGVSIVIERDAMAAVLGLQLTALDVDPQLSVQDVEALRSAGIDVRVAGAWLRDLRTIKDEGEMANLERACDITARALAALATELAVGQTELAIARRLETLFADLGADDRGFRTIVASGPNAAIPHHQPTTRALQVGDLVVIDCGALVEGYHADMTRTFCVAAEPSLWQRDVHGVVLAAQRAGIAAAVPGATARAVDEAARTVIDAAGFGSDFTHGTGHGVGLQIHEPPMITPGSADSISAGSPITVEPGIYVPGRGGVRIEDTIVVGNPARVLTNAPRDLMVVG